VPLNLFLSSAIATLCFVAALFFVRYLRSSGDRLFLWFAISFALEGANRTAMTLSGQLSEADPLHYTIRAVSFLLIAVAIVIKNARAK
jgi:hypothetical protein